MDWGSIDWSGVIGLTTGVVGTGWGIYTSVRSRQLSRPSPGLHVGLLEERELLPRSLRKKSKNTLIFGVPGLRGGHAVIPCIYRLTNPTKLPLTDLTLGLQYPAEFLIDEAAVLNDDETTGTMVRGIMMLEREVVPAADMTFVRYNLAKLRPGETVILPDLMKIPKFNAGEPGSPPEPGEEGARLSNRLQDIPGYFNSCRVHATVWSSNCPPIAKDVNLICFSAGAEKDLERCFGGFATAIWDGKRPSPGFYFKPFWMKKPLTVELSELITLPKRKPPLTGEAIGRSVMKSARSLGYFDVPPWGLYGESFELVDNKMWLIKEKKVPEQL